MSLQGPLNKSSFYFTNLNILVWIENPQWPPMNNLNANCIIEFDYYVALKFKMTTAAGKNG